MNLEERFEAFIQTGLYLRNWSPRTPPIYRRAFCSFRDAQTSIGPSLDGTLTKAQLESWIVGIRARGLSPAGVNIFIRAMNAFCSWLHEQGDLRMAIAVRQLKNQQKPVTPFSESEIDRLLKSKPKRLTYLRTWTLIVLLLDTGCRIDEALGLTRDRIDFDNLLLTVNGKGGKQRKVPFSGELRRHLWPFVQRSPSRVFVFATNSGSRLSYRNAYRNIKLCFAAASVEGPHVHPHNLRHTFACNFINGGGSIFVLSRILGHSSITTTQVYLRGLQIEELAESHRTPLARQA